VDQGKQDMSRDNPQVQDIAEIKAGLRELSKTVQRLAKQLGPNKPAMYSQVLYQGYNLTTETAGATRAARAAGALTLPVPGNIKHIKPVSPVHARQLIINPGNKSESQKNCTGEELVKDINTALGIKDVTRACRLSSGSALITLLGVEEKTK
jgi:hypothetical protein